MCVRACVHACMCVCVCVCVCVWCCTYVWRSVCINNLCRWVKELQLPIILNHLHIFLPFIDPIGEGLLLNLLPCWLLRNCRHINLPGYARLCCEIIVVIWYLVVVFGVLFVIRLGHWLHYCCHFACYHGNYKRKRSEDANHTYTTTLHNVMWLSHGYVQALKDLMDHLWTQTGFKPPQHVLQLHGPSNYLTMLAC